MTTTVSPEELVNIDQVTRDAPVFHKLSYDEAKGDLRTLCGHTVSFRVKSPLVPFKHAKLFAIACSSCFTDNGQSSA